MKDKGPPATEEGGMKLHSEGDKSQCVEPSWLLKGSRTADPGHAAIGFIAFDKVGSTTVRRLIELATHTHLCNPWMDEFQCYNTTHIVNVMAMFDSTYCLQLEGRRKCKAFTVLRHPVARILSSYAYFCKGCEEGGRQCRGAERPTELVCPDMTVEEYTKQMGNVYTKSLAPDGTVASALIALRPVLVMTERDLKCRKPLTKLSTWIGWPKLATQRKLHANKYRAVKKAKPSEELYKILADDIKLYETFSKAEPWSCNDLNMPGQE